MGRFCLPGDIWQYLDAVLVVTAGGYSWLLVGRFQEYLPQQRPGSLMSTAAGLRNPELQLSSHTRRPQGVGAVFISTLQRRTPRFREVKLLAQEHTAGGGPTQDWLSLKPTLSVTGRERQQDRSGQPKEGWSALWTLKTDHTALWFGSRFA